MQYPFSARNGFSLLLILLAHNDVTDPGGGGDELGQPGDQLLGASPGGDVSIVVM